MPTFISTYILYLNTFNIYFYIYIYFRTFKVLFVSTFFFKFFFPRAGAGLGRNFGSFSATKGFQKEKFEGIPPSLLFQNPASPRGSPRQWMGNSKNFKFPQIPGMPRFGRAPPGGEIPIPDDPGTPLRGVPCPSNPYRLHPHAPG